MWSRAPSRVVARTLAGAAALVAFLLAPFLPVLSPAAPAAAAAAAPPAPVVLIGASGLTWSDIDPGRTPVLASFAQQSAIGHLSVRAVYPLTCPVDAWLTVGAARRAASERDVPASSGDDADPGPRCPAIPPVVDQRVRGWQVLEQYNATLGYDAHLGLLGSSAAAAGTTVLAAGAGAAVAAADDSGAVARQPVDPGSLTRADLAAADLSLVDLGGIDDAGAVDRGEQVAALDAAMGRLLPLLPERATVILVAGGNSRATPDLQAIAVRGEDFPPGLLTSTSTRQDGLVLLTDVTPTLFALTGMPPASTFVGAPMTSVPRDPAASFEQRRQDLIDQTRKVEVSGQVAMPFFGVFAALQLALYGFAGWVFGRRGPSGPPRPGAVRVVGAAALLSSAVPAATYLANVAPWWRWRPAALGLVSLVVVWAVVLAAVADRLGRGRGVLAKVGAVAGLTVGVMAADIVTGGALQVASLMGYSPVVAGRLYGFGNVAFALFATSLVFLAAWSGDLARRAGRAPERVVLGIGAVGLLVDGLPAFGSDFGGMLALATGFGVFALSARGVRLTPGRLLATFGAGVVTVVVVSVADWLRPPASRSHLGTFVQQVLDGELGDIVGRKLASNLDMLFSSVLTLLVPVVLVALAVVVLWSRRRTPAVLAAAYDRAPLLRPALNGWLTVMLVGLAFNDSGVAIPAVGLMLVLPFLIVVAAEVERRPAPGPATRPADAVAGPTRPDDPH